MIRRWLRNEKVIQNIDMTVCDYIRCNVIVHYHIPHPLTVAMETEEEEEEARPVQVILWFRYSCDVEPHPQYRCR